MIARRVSATIGVMGLIVALSSAVPAPLASRNRPAAVPRRILFIGNSYTSQVKKSLMQMLAQSPHRQTTFEFATKGGAALLHHLADTKTLDRIRTGNWDVVVLQEQSQLPALPGKPGEAFQKSVDDFSALIRKAGAEPMLYMTWGRRDGDATNKTLFPDYATMQKKLSTAYRKAARRNGISLAPVGEAWSLVRRRDKALGTALYAEDASHPSGKGAFLVSCVFFRALFNDRPESIRYRGTLNRRERQAINQAVSSIMLLPGRSNAHALPPGRHVGDSATINANALTSIREFDLRTVEKLGRRIHKHDTCAARATDILFEAIGGDKELLEQGIRGWIVHQEKDGLVVRFIKQTNEGHRPAFDITFDADGKGTIKEATGMLSSDEAAQFRARQLAIGSITQLYSPHYNTVVLPDVDGDGFLVYALAASMDPDDVVITGHYRITVSADGTEVERVDKLFKSYLVLSKKDMTGNIPEGSEVVAMNTRHVVSDTPVETHVFINLLHGLDLCVVTLDGNMWLIEKGRISRRGNMADYVK